MTTTRRAAPATRTRVVSRPPRTTISPITAPHPLQDSTHVDADGLLRLQRSVGNQAALDVVERAAAAEAHEAHFHIQRHAAFEHYLLGQVAPDDLANLPFIREAVQQQKDWDAVEQARQTAQALADSGLADSDAAKAFPQQGPRPQVDQVKLQQAKHTLEQEMQRLEAFISNPEATPGLGAGEAGEVKKGVDGKWQVPYVSVPVLGGNVVIAYSEINTMPDLFGNPEAIKKTPKDKVLALLQGIRQQTYIKLDRMYVEIFGQTKYKLGKTYAFGTDFQGATGPRDQAVNDWAYEKRTELQVNTATKRKGEESEQYFAALERNACHFAPESWNQWQSYHTTALQLAKQSAASHDAAEQLIRAAQAKHQPPSADVQNQVDALQKDALDKSNQALLQNAFGEHYLQDSFAAGHLIDKTKIMQWFVQYLEATGVELGSTARAKGQWAMVKTVARQKTLKSNPQMLHDKIIRGQINDVAAANAELGMSVEPEIVFMMWWRNAAKTNDSYKHLTPKQASQLCPVGPAAGNPGEAQRLMQALITQGFAKLKTEGWIWTHRVFSLDQTQIDAVGGGGAYDATLAERMATSGKQRDFTREAQEFNLNAYAAFLNNAYVQGATKYFHDKYCARGLEVIAGNGDALGRIYGDNAMMSAGGQKGVQYSAETSKWSREAIFDVLAGEDEKHNTQEIKLRFPAKAIDPDMGGKELPLDKWNEALKALGDGGMFAEAKSGGARMAYKFSSGGGISGGHALDVKAVTAHEVF